MKKFKILVGAVALFALVAANVWNAATVFGSTELDIPNIERMAEGESQGINATNGEDEANPSCDYWYIEVRFGDNTTYEVESKNLEANRWYIDMLAQSRGGNVGEFSRCVAGELTRCTPGEKYCRARDCHRKGR